MVRGNVGFAQHSYMNALYFIAGFSFRARQALLRGCLGFGNRGRVETSRFE